MKCLHCSLNRQMNGISFIMIRNSDKKVLIQRRTDDAPVNPGKYCFPGGGIEPFESDVEAVIRETHEETGLLLEAKDFFPLLDFPYIQNNKIRINRFFVCYVEPFTIIPTEGEMMWKSIDEIRNLELALEENFLIQFIEKLLSTLL